MTVMPRTNGFVTGRPGVGNNTLIELAEANLDGMAVVVEVHVAELLR